MSNAREANDNQDIPPGVVVMLTFIGYAIPAGTTVNPGTITQPGTSPLTGGQFTSAFANDFAEQQPIPIYVFNYGMPRQPNELPIHDHRDNVTGGGFRDFRRSAESRIAVRFFGLNQAIHSKGSG